MVTILDPSGYDRWLQCIPEEAKVFFKSWQGPQGQFEAKVARTRDRD